MQFGNDGFPPNLDDRALRTGTLDPDHAATAAISRFTR